MKVNPRTPLIAGNWKLHLRNTDACTLLETLHRGLQELTAQHNGAVDVVVAPVFTLLAICAERKGSIGLAAQDVHHEDQGAFTGEVSAPFLMDAGTEWCIVGHSERRQLFGESDEVVGLKASALGKHGIRPILCIGETLDERNAGQTLDVVLRQLKAGVRDLSDEHLVGGAIAYEPVWAIGTGKTASAEDAQEVHQAIRAWLRSERGALAEQVRVLYGGSVKASNAEKLLAQPDIDGALVGGASLEAESFLAIVRAALE